MNPIFVAAGVALLLFAAASLRILEQAGSLAALME